MRASLFGLGVVCAVLAVASCANPPAARVCANGIVCPDGTQCAAVQTVCIVGNCGNGLIDPGEQCDDGNILEGDGCSASCRIESCGNGVQDPGEKCDDGNNVNGDGCSADCKSQEACGNGIIDVKNGVKGVAEVCDDGNTISGDGCSADCLSTEVCGNGIKDIHELCDDGGAPGGCNDDCQGGTGCGDGSIDKDAGGQPLEQCDDGNTNDNDDCLSSKTSPATTCKLAKCGDHVVQTAGSRHEDCDPGTGGVPLEDSTCNIDCTTPSCGDGKVNRHFAPDGTHVEQCDGGMGVNNNNADCTAACQINVCGDGHQDTTGVNKEDCDHGANNGKPGDTCTTTCHIRTCGNGVLEQDEQCDDGTTNNGPNNRCTTSCKFNVCGDGLTFTGTEQCDDGINGTPKDTMNCDVDCTAAVCGDGHLNTAANEVCDHGANNGKPGDSCSITCQTVSCGNGTVEQGEECDDGLGNGVNKRCTACKLNVCGDGHTLTGTEQCDDGVGGNKTDSMTCDDDCTFSVCGDGHLNTTAGEVCDHGANNGKVGDTCDLFCHTVGCGNGFVDTGEQCDPGLHTPAIDSATCDFDCTAPVCGDGHTNTLHGETCDDGNLNGNPCNYGDQNCSRCNSTCTGTVKPGGPFCGDHVLNGPEVCDQGSLNGTKCAYGDLTCLSGAMSPICNINCDGLIANPNGNFCGDNVVQSQFHEQCDPGGGLTPGETATCDNDCSFAVCGDGHKNATSGEACDDGNTSSCGSCSATCGAVTLAKATGTIVVPDGSKMTNGDTFTLDDGFHPALVFEYQKTGTFGNGHVHIVLESSGADTDAMVRDKTIAAINGVLATLDIVAADGSAGGAAGTVLLTNSHLSSLGNNPISETVVSALFTVSGMAGGLGGDCGVGVGCASNADCAAGSCNLATARCQ